MIAAGIETLRESVLAGNIRRLMLAAWLRLRRVQKPHPKILIQTCTS